MNLYQWHLSLYQWHLNLITLKSDLEKIENLCGYHSKQADDMRLVVEESQLKIDNALLEKLN